MAFITTANGDGFPQRLAAGVEAAHGTIISTLRCGVTVDSDWTSPALAGFASPQVGAVASVILNVEDETQLAGCGVFLSLAGRRRISGGGKRTPLAKMPRLDGPLLSAGFYRRGLLQAALPAIVKLGEPCADLELAMCLKKAGWQCAPAFESIVLGRPEKSPTAGFRLGQSLERLYRRHGAAFSPAWHAADIARETLGGLIQPWRLPGHILGRIAGFCTPDASQVDAVITALRSQLPQSPPSSSSQASRPISGGGLENRLRKSA